MSAAGSGEEETGRARRTERASTGALVPGTFAQDCCGPPQARETSGPKGLARGLGLQEERGSPHFPPAGAQLTQLY